ncbi:PREDICTED: uncharacterized protein LOC104777105 isoform X1 [Camelina sativa]|uniref:Uncharacterized protein LOC104777105 isoform X1 n=1 Tax=Camelina sativa TaxID=90675 RepID=A0ABM0YE76_CAMSA|nr:PREDICTED: uncharacterized protein LOC104777105 isoform X1 [Camelina sativa]
MMIQSVFLEQLQNLAGQHSNVLENLTPTVRKRVEVLREIQDLLAQRMATREFCSSYSIFLPYSKELQESIVVVNRERHWEIELHIVSSIIVASSQVHLQLIPCYSNGCFKLLPASSDNGFTV